MNDYDIEYIASCFEKLDKTEINKFKAKYKNDLIESILNKNFNNMHILANIIVK